MRALYYKMRPRYGHVHKTSSTITYIIEKNLEDIPSRSKNRKILLLESMATCKDRNCGFSGGERAGGGIVSHNSRTRICYCQLGDYNHTTQRVLTSKN
jgi:hypothetical protein